MKFDYIVLPNGTLLSLVDEPTRPPCRECRQVSRNCSLHICLPRP